MKIALISQPLDAFIPPSMNSIGIWINEISRRLAREHTVFVYGRRGIANRRGIGEPVITRYILSLPPRWLARLSKFANRLRSPKRPFFSSYLYALEYILPIALDLRRNQVDIVHLQNFSQFVPIIRAFNPRIKIVLHMRCEWLSLLDREIIEPRIQKTDLVLGVSQYITDKIRDKYPRYADKCQVAYTGVDTHVFQPLPETPDRPKTSPKILFVGRITPEKGVHILLEAFKQIAPRHPQLEMELVGSFGSLPREQLVGMSKTDQIRQLEQFYSGPDYRTHLQGILPPELQDRVRYIGNIPYAKTIGYYQHADILVNPALSEPFGRSLIEGSACGAPIIASQTDGMVELVQPGKTGYLVRPGDVAELAQAIETLLDNEPLRQSMGQAARRFAVEQFSWEKIHSNLLQQYHSLHPVITPLMEEVHG